MNSLRSFLQQLRDDEDFNPK